MSDIDFVFEVDHDKRVFRARNDAQSLVIEGASRDELRQHLRDVVRSKFAGTSSIPRRIVMRDNLGATVEQIILG